MSLDFGKLNFSVAFNPTSAFPLDARSYFESYESAVLAAASADEVGSSTTTYYYGQTVAVVENNIATLYTIQPDKTLAEVGGKIDIDENVFALNENGKLNLYGFANAVSGAQLVKSADGKLSWVKPDQTTVEGLQTTVGTLSDEVESLQEKIGSPAEGETAATGIYAIVSNIYTKQEVDTAIANAGHLKRQKITSLDEISLDDEGVENIIFMLSKTGEAGDYFDEYMVIDGQVEKIGNSTVDLSGYVEKVEGSRLINSDEIAKLTGIENGAQKNVINTVDETQFSLDETGNLTLLDIALSKVAGLQSALDSKVDKVEGKGLSTNDLTDELVSKINSSEANVINAVKVNGTVLDITDKAVNISVAGTDLGVVKSSEAENKIKVTPIGEMEVNSVNVNKLVQTDGETLILDGGSSTQG